MEKFDLRDLIKTNRENLQENTLKMYLANLRTLNNKKEITSLDFLFDFDVIMQKLEKYKLRTRRNFLTGVLVALGVYNTDKYNEIREKYRKVLENMTIEMNAELELHEKTKSQSENWTTLNELRKNVLTTYKRDVKRFGILTRTSPSIIDVLLYQKYVIAALYLLRPAVRLNYIMEIIRDRDEIQEGRNYLLIQSDRTKYFIFGEFKNVKIIGKQEQKVEPEINKILNVWLNKFNKTNSLLLNTRMKPLTSNGLSKLIGEVFSSEKRKVTLNLLRHIWASETVDLDQNKKESELAKMMMHNSTTQKEYAKK
tara:strand:- start:795 stop:1727 length:933 start_codon:yes stop_codon:yes gene_type:complete